MAESSRMKSPPDPGESEEAFKMRVLAELVGQDAGPVRVMMYPAEA